MDPHDSIHAMDAELHEELYDLGYDPCYPGARTEHQMVQATQAAVEKYMHQLEADHDVYDIKEAEWNMLMSEGVYEAEVHRSNALNQFYNAMKTCTEESLDAMNKIKIFGSKPSLIGGLFLVPILYILYYQHFFGLITYMVLNCTVRDVREQCN